MQNFGGMESMSPDEGGGSGSEQVREQSSQAFAGTAAAMQQIQREEKKAKKKDDGVAQAILQFLTDDQRQHFSVLISRLVALNCPSTFILAILSLISPDCLAAAQEALKDTLNTTAEETVSQSIATLPGTQLDEAGNRQLVDWITRMQLVLGIESNAILLALRTPDGDIDGTILQLTTFVLQDFFRSSQKDIAFEKLHPLAAGILQTIFEPYFDTPQLPEQRA